MTRPLPTHKDEAYRYADLDALARSWPVQPDYVLVPTGGSFARTILHDAGGVVQIALSVGPQAAARINLLNCGGEYGRVAIDVTLHAGADFQLNAVQIGDADQTLEIVTNVTHAEAGATSRQTVRSVAGGRATVTYLGKVAVARGADGTDSEQAVRAMLLDRSATANAKPELEIYADDVKCAHGCAIGELDAGGLFYLASRGLDPSAAKRLMVQAFVAEVIDGDDALTGAALAKLEAML